MQNLFSHKVTGPTFHVLYSMAELVLDVSITDTGWSSEGASFVLWPERLGIFIVVLFICLFLSFDTESR